MSRLLLTLAFPAAIIVVHFGWAERETADKMELPTSPSEDMSHLLVKPASAAWEFDFDAPHDYLPDPNVDWVVSIGFEGTASVPREKINGLLNVSWLEGHGRPTVYGFSPDETHWTFVNAADSPDSFTALKLAWPLWDAIDDQPQDVSPDDLERWRPAVEERVSAIGRITTKIDRSGEDALAAVAGLSEIAAEYDRGVTLILTAPEGKRFSGQEVWDVMLCLGLDYGDGDLFHWINNLSFGDDHFFTVETSTPPGYFIPQRMASGEGNVADLNFSFSIPRSADPVAVFDSMANAVEYARQRLGGDIVLGTGEPFDKAAEEAKIAEIVRKLQAAGFTPGESRTCRVF